MKTKTKWIYQGKELTEANNFFGFVYLVTCTHPECSKKYIGRKFFYSNFGKKTQKESDWKSYKTSSSYVKEAIALYGESYFIFEIVQLFNTRGGVVSGEVELQWDAKVLSAVNEEGDRVYWNRAIGGIKFLTKEVVSEETRAKISAAMKGKVAPNKGKPHTKEARAKMSASKTGVKLKPFTEEHKNKIGAAQKGKSKPSNPNKKVDDWQILQVLELLEGGLKQKEIRQYTGLTQPTISGIAQLRYKRYKEIYEQKESEKLNLSRAQ